MRGTGTVSNVPLLLSHTIHLIRLISKLYDEHAFPEAVGDEQNWSVVDDKTGKPVRLPHPVYALRLWDADAGKYKDIESRLAGAPGGADEAQFWADFKTELEAAHGKEYLDGLVSE